MKIEQQQLIEWQLAKLNTSFAHHLDRAEYEPLIAVFAPDGLFVRHGTPLRGHDEIRKAMSERLPMTTRHLVTNTHFYDMTEDTAKAVLYTLVQAGPPRRDGRPLVYQARQVTLMEFHNEYVRTTDGWRIARLENLPVFVPEDQ
ncbi:nuclear transport factor 2 family protein [Streptomyces sp. A30]|uniref:nuclear transport factor 2 family protein n=1 Tax=Streptomyces sp. A30 TaxID=2789273 RepID=UPI003980DC8F